MSKKVIFYFQIEFSTFILDLTVVYTHFYAPVLNACLYAIEVFLAAPLLNGVWHVWKSVAEVVCIYRGKISLSGVNINTSFSM